MAWRIYIPEHAYVGGDVFEVVRMRKDMEKIAWNMLKEMYEKAEPPLDLDKAIEEGKLKEKPKGGELPWYQQHYLSEEDIERIRSKHIKDNKLSKHDAKSLDYTILDFGPTSNKDLILKP
jgi:hypothetical protein